MDFYNFYEKINEGLLKACEICDINHDDNSYVFNKFNTKWKTIINVKSSADKNDLCGYKKCPVFCALKLNEELYFNMKRKVNGRRNKN